MKELTPQEKLDILAAAEVVKGGDFALVKKMMEFIAQMREYEARVNEAEESVQEAITRASSIMEGKNGENYVLTEQDKEDIAKDIARNVELTDEEVQQIAKNVEVPVVEKVIERVIEHVPAPTNVVSHDAEEVAMNAYMIAEDAIMAMAPTIEKLKGELPGLGKEIRDSLELLKGKERLNVSAIDGLDDEHKKLSDSIIDRAIGILDQRTSFLIQKVSNLSDRVNNINITGGSGSPGGSNTQVQFNDSGSFGGDAGLTYNKTTDMLTLAGSVTLPTTSSSSVGVYYAGSNRFIHNYNEAGSLGKNTFIGINSGNFTLSTGGGATDLASFNTGVGDDTLTALTTGQNNVALGWKAGYAITTGTRHTLIGYNAGYQITTANFCNFVGDAAGGRVTSGDGNNGFGYVAGYALTTGQHNLHLGSYAGYGSDGTNGPQTDDFGILIGYFANRSVVAATKLTGYVGIGQSVLIDSSNQMKLGGLNITDAQINGTEISIGKDPSYTAHPKYYTYYDYDDASNYSRGVVGWDGSSNMIVGTQSAGTGANNSVLFQRNGTTLLSFNGSKVTMHEDINFSTGNTRDIGTGATPVRRIYVGTDIELGNTSDTTIARVSAGLISVEGKTVVDISSTQTLTSKTLTSPAINTPTLGGHETMLENAALLLDPALSADGTYNGIIRGGTAGATLAFGDLCYLDPTDSRWELADANAAQGADGDSRGILGICILAAASDGSATTMLLNGIVRADTAFPAMTVNNQMYVSETAGDITGTQPTTTDVVIRVVGVALTADELYFNPSMDFITHT